MMEALGSLAITGSTLFGYNRKNFLYDRKMRQEQEFQIAEMRLRVAELWREDVRDITEMTERKMDTYMIVNALQLGFTVTLFVEGRLETGTPQWLLYLYMVTLSGAFLFLLLSVWLAMHASVVTQSSAVRLLTQLVRPPIPSWEQLESMRTYAAAFEAVNTFQMFRVPVVQTLGEGRYAGVGGFSGRADAEPGSVAADPWGLERRGDDLYELARRSPADTRHVKLLREASRHWRAYDAFARVTMTIGTILFCKSMGYFCLGYVLINDGAPWAAWTVMGLMLAIASAVLRLDVSMTRSEYRQTQALLVVGPLLTCAVAAGWATWSARIQRVSWLLLPFTYLAHALFLLSFLRVCRVAEQPCGSVLPLSFRSVLYLDVFGWLTRKGRVKASSPSARSLTVDDPEVDGGGAVVTCQDVCDVLAPTTNCLQSNASPKATLTAKDWEVAREVGGVISSFNSSAVQEHLNENDKAKLRRLSRTLQTHAAAAADSPPSDWVQLNAYSDCGQKVPYFVHVASGEVSHRGPRDSAETTTRSSAAGSADASSSRALVSPASAGEAGGLAKSLSFAEKQIEALASSTGAFLPAPEPQGPPVAFAPAMAADEAVMMGRMSTGFKGSSLFSSDQMGATTTIAEIEQGRARQEKKIAAQRNRRRASFHAVHGQNFPRNFDPARSPPPLRPEDADRAAASSSSPRASSEGRRSGDDGDGAWKASSGSPQAGDGDDDDDSDDGGNDFGGPMQGIGPVGVVPVASEDTFAPSSFVAAAVGDDFSTGRDVFKPGQLPFVTFRSGVRLLAGLFFLGTLWSTLQAAGFPDIPDRVLPESIHVSGAHRGEHEDDQTGGALYGLLGTDDGLLPGLQVRSKWPSLRFQPRGLSADRYGKYLAISDEFNIYLTEVIEDTRAGEADHAHSDGEAGERDGAELRFIEEAPLCPALEGQATRDIALVCPPGEKKDPLKCDVLVLHDRGRRVVACEFGGGEEDERSAAEQEIGGDRRLSTAGNETSPANRVWKLASSWLRDIGDGKVDEEVISIVLSFDCGSASSLDEREACLVVGTSHGRVIALRPHLQHKGELVPKVALWNTLGKAAVTEQVQWRHTTSLMTAIPGGFVLSLRSGQHKLQAIDGRYRKVFGEWALPQHRGREWTALAGGATHIFLSSQGGACADEPEQWRDSKSYSCKDYVDKQWCTQDGKSGNGWSNMWGSFERYMNSAHTAFTACCACGGGDRQGEGSSSQIWKFPLPERLRTEVADRIKADSDRVAANA